MKSFDFALLAGALQKRPRLYFHPAVQAQVNHLRRLRDDENAWVEVWEVHVDAILGIATPPEVERVEQILEQLVDAHVSALLPGMVVVPERIPGNPGEPGGFENPHPTHAAAAWISPQRLFASWRPLRKGCESPFAKRILRAMPLQPPTEYVRDVVALAHDVIDENPPMWSALIQRVAIGEPPNDLSDDDRQFWLEYRQPFKLRTTVDLDRVVRAALTDLQQRAPKLKVSRAAYLASAVLAAHLGDATPARVQYTVDNYRRAHGV